MLDCTFEVTSAVVDIRAFLKQKVLCLTCAFKREPVIALRRHNPLLHPIEFDIQYCSKISF